MAFQQLIQEAMFVEFFVQTLTFGKWFFRSNHKKPGCKVKFSSMYMFYWYKYLMIHLVLIFNDPLVPLVLAA